MIVKAMSDVGRMGLGICAAAVLITACSGGVRPPARVTNADQAGLVAAVEDFYRAEDAEKMRAAIARAEAAGPESSLTHEMKAIYAGYRAEDDLVFEELLAAVGDLNDDAVELHLHRLADLAATMEQRRDLSATLESLSRGHERPAIRSLASHYLAKLSFEAGDTGGYREALSVSTRDSLDLALIGSWRNDQGLGFEIPKRPEEKIDLSETVDGSRGKIGWRRGYPLDPYGVVDLERLVYPATNSMAYLAAGVRVSQEQEAELRLSTGDPVKVWVDGRLVFEEEDLDLFRYDGIVVPLTLKKGESAVLIKTASHDGGWRVMARLTGRDGRGAEEIGLSQVEPSSGPVAEPASKDLVDGLLDVVDYKVREIEQGTARGMLLRVGYAELLSSGLTGMFWGEVASYELSESLVSLALLYEACWAVGHAERAREVLEALLEKGGDALIAFELERIRYWWAMELRDKAVEAARALAKRHPENTRAKLEAAWLLSAMGLHVDALEMLEGAREGAERPLMEMDIADENQELGRTDQAWEGISAALELLPGHPSLLVDGYFLALERNDREKARELMERLIAADPGNHPARTLLAYQHYEDRASSRARAQLEEVVKICPQCPGAYGLIADIEYEDDDRESAAANWRAALERAPMITDLYDRLELAVQERGEPWRRDVPTDEEIEALLATAERDTRKLGGNTAVLLDDDVTVLNRDGSNIKYITIIYRALKRRGSEHLVRQRLLDWGPVQLLKAYAVGRDGERVDASAVYDDNVWFRNLGEGMITVLQYRVIVPPRAPMSGHWKGMWSFQQEKQPATKRRWVVWANEDTPVSHHATGDIRAEESKEGGWVRRVWSAEGIAAAVSEPFGPPASEREWGVVASNAAAWDELYEWNTKFVRESIKESRGMFQVCDEIAAKANDTTRRLERLQEWVVENIDYHQHYAEFIEGWRPHAASQVFMRGYGDCKDKAVLFVTMAKIMDIEAHLALVRTRDLGPVEPEVPTFQFNHVIVYVPAQEGLEEERFFDPTVSGLDVRALRSDVQGTLAQIVDSKGGPLRWKEIPYQTTDYNSSETTVRLKVERGGAASGEIVIESNGQEGEVIRRMAQDSDDLKYFLQFLAQRAVPSSSVTRSSLNGVEDLGRPVRVKMSFESDKIGRAQGREIVLEPFSDWDVHDMFFLPERKTDLVVGIPWIQRWRTELSVNGGRVKKVPANKKVSSECMTLERKVTRKGKDVTVDYEFESKCGRIGKDEYPRYKTLVDEMYYMLREEILIK